VRAGRIRYRRTCRPLWTFMGRVRVTRRREHRTDSATAGHHDQFRTNHNWLLAPPQEFSTSPAPLAPSELRHEP